MVQSNIKKPVDDDLQVVKCPEQESLSSGYQLFKPWCVKGVSQKIKEPIYVPVSVPVSHTF